MGYTSSAIKGFTWQTLLRVSTGGVSLLKIIVLTRLVSPVEFGIFSLVIIALGLTEAFTQTGVNVTLLQSAKPLKSFINSAWVIAITRGLVIALVMIAASQPLSFYFNQPSLMLLICVAALVPVIKGFINPAIIGMQKELHFSADAIYRFSLVTVEVFSTIVLVLVLGPVAGMVGGILAAAIYEVVISFIFFQLRPRFQLQAAAAREIMHQAGGLTVASLFGYLNENMDNLIIGRVLGTYNLGLYQPTYSLSHKPNYELAKAANHSLLPIYSRIAEDKLRLSRAFWRATLTSLGIGLVLSLPLLFFPGLMFKLVLGSDWSEAAQLVPYLAVAGLLQSFLMVCYSLLLATKRLRLMNLHAALTFFAMFVGVWYFSQSSGLVGAAIGLIISRVVGIPILVYGVRQTLK